MSRKQYNNSDLDIGEIVGIRDGFATVELKDKDACRSCSARYICKPTSSGKRVLNVENSVEAKVGDSVLIEQSGLDQLKLASMQYGLPLLGFLVTVITLHSLINNSLLGIPKEIVVFVAGMCVILLSGFVVSLWSRRKVKQRFSVFHIKEILNT